MTGASNATIESLLPPLAYGPGNFNSAKPPGTNLLRGEETTMYLGSPAKPLLFSNLATLFCNRMQTGDKVHFCRHQRLEDHRQLGPPPKMMFPSALCLSTLRQNRPQKAILLA